MPSVWFVAYRGDEPRGCYRTLEQLAHALGVSRTTASNALRDDRSEAGGYGKRGRARLIVERVILEGE